MKIHETLEAFQALPLRRQEVCRGLPAVNGGCLWMQTGETGYLVCIREAPPHPPPPCAVSLAPERGWQSWGLVSWATSRRIRTGLEWRARRGHGMLAWSVVCMRGWESFTEWSRKCQGPEAGACSTNQRGRKEIKDQVVLCHATLRSGEKRLQTQLITVGPLCGWPSPLLCNSVWGARGERSALGRKQEPLLLRVLFGGGSVLWLRAGHRWTDL